MNTLLEIEQIKQLKARYLRGLDTNDWELFASSMAEDCTGRYNNGKLSFNSKENDEANNRIRKESTRSK